jgi:L-alanine-L-anticapsin ligase
MEVIDMNREKILVIADLGGCPPDMFYEAVAKKYNIITYIPRPFAITQNHASLIEKYSVAVIKDLDYFKDLSDFEHPESIYWAQEEYNKPEENVVEDIIKVANMFEVTAITTNNELFIVPMARATEALGLRGAGVSASIRARDKNLMRETFNQVGIKSIKSKRVSTVEEFLSAIDYVGFPLILKPTFLASSIGVTFVKDRDRAQEVFMEVLTYLEQIEVPAAVKIDSLFIVEEYLEGSYDDWYQEPGYSDYVSVEGFMVNGTYFPLAIHDKTPQIGFTETSHITSSILDDDAKSIILEAAKKANEGLGLEYCSTHTEIKLMKNREVGVIETAARFAGWNMIPNVRKAFHVDGALILADILVQGHSDELPEELLDHPVQYVADFHLYPTDFIKSGCLKSGTTKIVIEEILTPENVLVGDTNITQWSSPAKGTEVDLTIFEAFNALVSIELVGSVSKDIKDSIHNIKKVCQLVEQQGALLEQ